MGADDVLMHLCSALQSHSAAAVTAWIVKLRVLYVFNIIHLIPVNLILLFWTDLCERNLQMSLYSTALPGFAWHIQFPHIFTDEFSKPFNNILPHFRDFIQVV